MYSEKELIEKFEKKKKETLTSCIVFDLIGMATYLLPGLGEIADVIWVPIAYKLSNSLFNSRSKSLITAVEEGLPGTDIIPTFTLNWHSYYIKNRTESLNKFILELKEERQMLDRHNLK